MIDVCLILEGSYPYVAGGVSNWVHQLITAMTDLKFGVIFISPHHDPTRTLKYEIPPHVIYLKELGLHDYSLRATARRQPTAGDLKTVKSFYESLSQGRAEGFKELVGLFRGEKSCFDLPTVFSSKEIWDLLVQIYDRHAPEVSFIDYFWTWRGTHLPILQVLQAEIPPAKIYHAVSTGYAGLLGAVAKVLHRQKLFLTEHGIYTHERMLEISQAAWIYERERRHYRADRELSFFKRWWIQLFSVMSSLTYAQADRIFTLYEGNKVRQILEGAAKEKISIISNGISPAEFGTIPRLRKKEPQIGFVGRVVTIKDVKTFLQAAKLLLAYKPAAQFYIVGPTDEEEEYFEECRLLVDALNLEGRVVFVGKEDPKKYYQFLDVVVLTSLSEAQPYVILEANLSGIPVVATDVGACREMLEGRDPIDQAIGPSGFITQVSNPEATARAVLKILDEPETCEQMALSGKERVRRYYDLDDLLSRYMNIYEQNL